MKPQLQDSVIPVLYRKGFIEENNIDITHYAKRFCSRNQRNGKSITRRDVEWYWEGNVRAEFDTVDAIHNRLINQINSPKFETFWMNKNAPTVLKAKRASQQQEGFWLLRPNAKEKKHFESALILGNDTERWIIPNVSLMAVEDILFKDFVQDTRAANTGRLGDIQDKSKIFRLWGTLIKKAYDFVPKEVQNEKLKEAFSGHPPTTEEGLEEFYGTPSKKRKLASTLEVEEFDEEHLVHGRKRKHISIGDVHVREFDDESILNPTLKPIPKWHYKPSPGAIAGPSASASPGPSIEAKGGEDRPTVADKTEKKIQALEKELAELKVAKDEIEHRMQSEIGRRRAAETLLDRYKAICKNLET